MSAPRTPAEAATEILATQAANHLAWMLGEMVRFRREDAADRGETITDAEIVESVRASILRMAAEAVTR